MNIKERLAAANAKARTEWERGKSELAAQREQLEIDKQESQHESTDEAIKNIVTTDKVAETSVFHVREEGRNGTVELIGKRLKRTFKKTFGRDDIQTIPVASISHIELDRRTLGADIIHVYVGTRKFTWKTPQAEELQNRIFEAQEL